jgi:hypothetical protein
LKEYITTRGLNIVVYIQFVGIGSVVIVIYTIFKIPVATVRLGSFGTPTKAETEAKEAKKKSKTSSAATLASLASAEGSGIDSEAIATEMLEAESRKVDLYKKGSARQKSYKKSTDEDESSEYEAPPPKPYIKSKASTVAKAKAKSPPARAKSPPAPKSTDDEDSSEAEDPPPQTKFKRRSASKESESENNDSEDAPLLMRKKSPKKLLPQERKGRKRKGLAPKAATKASTKKAEGSSEAKSKRYTPHPMASATLYHYHATHTVYLCQSEFVKKKDIRCVFALMPLFQMDDDGLAITTSKAAKASIGAASFRRNENDGYDKPYLDETIKLISPLPKSYGFWDTEGHFKYERGQKEYLITKCRELVESSLPVGVEGKN